jgi:hypothetical protein
MNVPKNKSHLPSNHKEKKHEVYHIISNTTNGIGDEDKNQKKDENEIIRQR